MKVNGSRKEDSTDVINKIGAITLPYKKAFMLKGKIKVFTFAEYIIPYACIWTYSNLKPPLNAIVFRHELGHIDQRGSPVIEMIKFQKIISKKKEPHDLVKRELEGLAMIKMMLDTMYSPDFYSHKALLKLIESSESKNCKKHDIPPLFRGFLMLWGYLMERVKATNDEELVSIVRDMLTRLYYPSFFTLNKTDGSFVFPTIVIWELFTRLKKDNLEKITWKDLERIANGLFQEKGWIEISPRHARTISSLNWALVLSETKYSVVKKIALRNFFETVFWIPINLWFLVNTKSLIAHKLRTIDIISKLEPVKSVHTPLGECVYEYTERIISFAKQMENDSLGEERFLLSFLPDITSSYLERIIEDFKTDDPKFFTKSRWEVIARNSTPLIEESNLGEFMRRYDKQRFHNTLKETIDGALYYPEDCIQIVEEKALKAYGNLEIEDIKEFFTR